MTNLEPQVLIGPNAKPVIIFAKGRTLYHAVAARDTDIALVTIPSLRYFSPALRNGQPYPPRRAASFWLNHDHRPITNRAMNVLRGLVSRKPTSTEGSPS